MGPVAKTFAAEPAKPSASIAPTTLTLTKPDATIAQIAEELKKQTGLAVDVPKNVAEKMVAAKFVATPFWNVVETLAKESGCRIAVASQGREVKLVKLADKAVAAPSAVDGPFRVVVRQVVGKRDFESDEIVYDLHLEMMWEPRFPVFYGDTEPHIIQLSVGNQGTQAKVHAAVTGYTHPLTLRLAGLPRTISTIDIIQMKLSAIGAEKMLPFVFDLPVSAKAIQEKEKVKVSLRPVKRTDKRVELTFDLEYPESHPALESFQQFSSENKLRLVSPDGRTKLETTDYSTEESGRRVRATYIFTKDLPANLAGWKAEYETPSPLMELKLNFKLKDIPLP